MHDGQLCTLERRASCPGRQNSFGGTRLHRAAEERDGAGWIQRPESHCPEQDLCCRETLRTCNHISFCGLRRQKGCSSALALMQIHLTQELCWLYTKDFLCGAASRRPLPCCTGGEGSQGCSSPGWEEAPHPLRPSGEGGEHEGAPDPQHAPLSCQHGRHHLQLHFVINVLPNFPQLPALPLSVTLLITDVSLHRGEREGKKKIVLSG